MGALSRREFLSTASAATLLAATPGCVRARGSAAPTVRPNILLVIADDQCWRDNGCYGNPDVKTPNIDQLAREGMRFTRCFTATAMCAPTRQQLYTGLFPIRNGAYPNHSQVYPGTRGIVHYLRDAGYRVGLVGKTHFGPPESFPFERVPEDGMGEFLSRDPEQPYCLVYASHNPHGRWTEGPQDAYDPAALTIPPYLVDNAETRKALAAYYAEVTALDTEVGACMQHVDAAGQRDDTMFIYTSEQGFAFPFGKWTCYDLGLRTAFVVRWPRRVKAGSTADAMVQYVDVLPTLIEAAGGTAPEGLDGRSFLPVLDGKTDTHNDAVFGVHTTRGINFGSECYPIRSIRTESHKYILNLNYEVPFVNTLIVTDKDLFWRSWERDAERSVAAAELVRRYQERPAEELYDVIEDPYEQNNLAGDPANRALMDALRQRLEAWMRQQGDEGVPTAMAE
jgi:arylsulfatase A-like enzyme